MTGFILGIGNVARAGKDTAANALVRDLGFKKISFADPLKELALHADPLITSMQRTVNTNVGHGRLAHTVHGMTWEGAKDLYPEVRRFLQNLGLGCRKLFGEDFWVNQAMEKAFDQNVVIPDVRFISEAEAIQARGGKVVRIDRPGFVGQGHISETELKDWDGWDAVVPNDGSVIDLEAKIVEEVKRLMSSRTFQPAIEGLS